MNRRSFLKAVVTIPVAAALPLPSIAEAAPLMSGEIGMFMGFNFIHSEPAAVALTAEFVSAYAANVETLLSLRERP